MEMAAKDDAAIVNEILNGSRELRIYRKLERSFKILNFLFEFTFIFVVKTSTFRLEEKQNFDYFTTIFSSSETVKILSRRNENSKFHYKDYSNLKNYSETILLQILRTKPTINKNLQL